MIQGVWRGKLSSVAFSKRSIGVSIGTILLASIFLLGRPLSASAAVPVPRPDVSLKDAGIADTTAQGFLPTLEFWLPGYGEYELAEGSYLHLEFGHSELLDPETSTLTVLVNGLPMASTRLTADNAGRTSWRIGIPKEKLNHDLNLIELQFLMLLGGEEHVNQENPALWSTVYETSHIHYQYASPLRFLGLPEPDLARFPEPFLRPTLLEGKVAVILPNEPSSSDFSAAASVAARFGQASGGKPFEAKLYTANQVDQQLRAGSDLVVIGRPDTNPFLHELSPGLPLKVSQGSSAQGFVDERNVPIPPENGVLQMVRSPWDSRFTVLVVSGGNDEGVHRAVRTLSSRLGMKTLQGPYAIISRAQEELRQGEAQGADRPAQVSLRQLGMADSTVKGAGKHIVAFNLDAPPVSSGTTATLDLVLTYSPLLDPDRSSAQVSVNGTLVWSQFLRPQGSERSTQRIQLPAASLRPGVNSIAVGFNLYAVPAKSLGPEAKERQWAVLHSDTAISFPIGGEQPPLDLINYPYPFVADGTPSNSYLVLPEGGEMLANGLQIAVALGRQSLGQSTEMRAGLASQLTDAAKREYNLVAYGLPENNGVVAEVGPKLPLALEAESRRSLQRTELVLLGIKDAASLGIVELVPSPWNDQKALLVVSGTSAETSERSVRALAGRLPAGNVVLSTLDDQGKDSLAGIELAGVAEQGTKEPLVNSSQIYSVAALAALLVAAIMLGVLSYRAVQPSSSPGQAP